MKADRFLKGILVAIAILLILIWTSGQGSGRATQFRMEVFTNTFTETGVTLQPDPAVEIDARLSEGWKIINAVWNPDAGQLMVFLQK